MPAPQSTFMYRTLRSLMRSGALHAEDSILVLFGGELDVRVLEAVGLPNFTMTNLNTGNAAEESLVVDARDVGFEDGSFDLVLAHAGLHHTSRPHQAVCEMHRVARRGVLFFESNDSLVMRALERLGLAARYEINATVLAGYRGGVDNSTIPNFVYRWTPREIEKLVRSLDATREPRIQVFREWVIGSRLVAPEGRGPGHRLGSALSAAATRALNRTLGSQGNAIAVFVDKGSAPDQPWIQRRGDVATLDVPVAREHSTKRGRWRARSTRA